MKALHAVPPHLCRRLASALESGLLTLPASEMAVCSTLGIRDGVEPILAALRELEHLGISARAAAAWIRQMEELTLKRPRPDLVWSGPEVPGVHARDTRRVFEELVAAAQYSIWISTYAYFDGPRAFELLAQRMADNPELRVTILLNIQRKRQNKLPAEEIVQAFARRFWQSDWPGAATPMIYYDPRSVDPEQPGGVLHAKAVVSDDEAVFITSANLTEAAFDRNFELGLLIRDRTLAQSVTRHFQLLISQEYLLLLPGKPR